MSVNIRNIDLLLALKQALARHAQESQPPLDALERQAQRTLEWVTERRRHWQRQVEAAQQALHAAEAALARCEATVYRDARGNVSRPDCSAHRAAVVQVVRILREVEAELRKTDEAKRRVEAAHQEFRRRRQHFAHYLSQESVQAQVFLEQRAASLRAYAAIRPAAGYSVPSPAQTMAGWAALGTVAAATGVVAVAAQVISRLAGHLQSNLGALGEASVERLLTQEAGLRVLPFDPAKHGFDRVFSAPGLPLIIVESKVSRDGELRLGQTQDGAQGSPTWVAAKAAAMADPDSALYSPANAAIAALVADLGVEHVPVLAAVVTTETGATNLYLRAADGTSWEPLPEGSDLAAWLQAATAGWQEIGVTPVALDALPLTEGIQGEEDFRKVPIEEMRRGLLRLQEMLPTIECGEGVSSDDWAAQDRALGLAHAEGYQRIYDAFYGADAIRVVQEGERYDILNGRHRIWLAREMGIAALPMHVTRRIVSLPPETPQLDAREKMP